MSFRHLQLPKLAALLLAVTCTLVVAQTRPRIEQSADLPRFTYAIGGKVEDVVRSPEKFASFAAELRKNTQSVLDGFDISDRSTRAGMVSLLATLDYLDGRYEDSLKRVAELRELRDKPANKLIAGQRLQVMAEAAKSDGPSGEAFQRDVGAGLRRVLDALPYALVSNDIRQAKEGADLMGEALIVGQLREVAQPIIDRNGVLSSDAASALVSARFALVGVLPLRQELVEAYSAYLSAHQVAKVDIWAARAVTLTVAQVRAPVAIGIWDSGVDTSLYSSQLMHDGGKPAVIAFDKDNRKAGGELMPLPADAAARIDELLGRLKGFSDLRSNIDSVEARAVKAYLAGLTADEYKPAMEQISMVGGYSHGTHVAGIALAGNPAARLVIGRIEFGWTLRPEPCPSEALSAREAKATQAYVDFFRAHRVRIVNMSWGAGADSFESDLEQCGIGKTAEERQALAKRYFELQKASQTRAFASAPEILFVTAAGNSNADATFTDFAPGGIVLPNLLTVGAVDSAGDEAPFTSYGPTVKVHADGYQVVSYLPRGSRVARSGTSMATPEVSNLAGKLLAVNPRLTPTDLVRIITGTSDASEDGRRHLINPQRALAAATAH